MDGLTELVARFLGAHGKEMPATAEEVETALSELHEDQFDEGVREGLDRAKASLANLAA